LTRTGDGESGSGAGIAKTGCVLLEPGSAREWIVRPADIGCGSDAEYVISADWPSKSGYGWNGPWTMGAVEGTLSGEATRLIGRYPNGDSVGSVRAACSCRGVECCAGGGGTTGDEGRVKVGKVRAGVVGGGGVWKREMARVDSVEAYGSHCANEPRRPGDG